MVKIEIDTQQLKKAIARLPIKERNKLIEELTKSQYEKEWDTILRSIDERLKRFPITQTEIEKEIEAYRKEKNAKRRR